MFMPKKEFKLKKVLIMGGSSGIGYSTADLFIKSGAKVFIVGKTKNNVTKAIERLNSFGNGSCLGTWEDLSTEDGVKNSVELCLEKFYGKIDVLVNSLGIAIPNSFLNISLEEWNKVMATNLTSYFLSCKYVSPIMKKIGSGKIINISSIAGRSYSELCGLHYSCSKAAIITLTKQLAAELGPWGINVNCICPGQTYTRMLEPHLKGNGEEEIKINIPLGKIATTEQQANVILFLASEGSSYMNGAILDVNGGQL